MKIGIYGFGAVGNAIYNELKEYPNLFVLVDPIRKEKYEHQEFYINEELMHPTFISNGIMDYIFVCLKNYDLVSSLDGLSPFIGKNTRIIPMLNGIMAHDIIKEKFPFSRVLYGCINVESNKKNNKTICGKILNLQFGDAYNIPVKSDVLYLHKFLSKYHIHNHVYHNMQRRVWLKWMLNMGINQVSALLNATYKDMSDPNIQDLFHDIFNEVYQVSLAYHIGITKDDIEDQFIYCSRFQSNRVTSLTLDFNDKGKNELDAFSKTLLELANKKNIDVPINKALYALLYLKDKKNKE